jgi:hypothetical protein
MSNTEMGNAFKGADVKYSKWAAIVATLAFGACTANNETTSDPAWSERALGDLDFIYAQLGEHHPGPVDTLNPWFRDWYERGYEEARRRAASITNYAGYYFAIQYYMVGFQDGHLGALGDYRIEAELERRWPGFLVEYDRGAFLAMGADTTDPRLPPAGARLISCDGTPAATMADSILQTYIGLWSINGVRPRLAPWLLVDEGNPWVRHPETCVFETNDGQSEWRLDWHPIDNDSLAALLETAATSRKPPIGIREFENRMWWITLSSFNSSDSLVMSGIDEVTNVVTERRAELLAADVIVFDVRGNQGGNSANGQRVAEALWGEAVMAALPARWNSIDWRVSAGNANFLRNFNLARMERNFGADAEGTRVYRAFVDAYDEAVSNNALFYSETAASSTPRATATNPVGGRVFFLTDSWCASACLGFADLMYAIDGVTHVGIETGADAIYIDNRGLTLPSEQGRLGFSMKVYRGRVRGHNVSYVPDFVWDGSMADGEDLERWIVGLASTSN